MVDDDNKTILIEAQKLKWASKDEMVDLYENIHAILNESIYKVMNQHTLNEIVYEVNKLVQNFIDQQKVIAIPLIDPIIEVSKSLNLDQPYKQNVDRYASVLNEFKINNEHDRKFIANKLGNLYKKYDCIDNYRICKSDKDGTETELYEFLKCRGCCGFYDELIYNDVTKTYYKFGFNHGH